CSPGVSGSNFQVVTTSPVAVSPFRTNARACPARYTAATSRPTPATLVTRRNPPTLAVSAAAAAAGSGASAGRSGADFGCFSHGGGGAGAGGGAAGSGATGGG